MGLTEKQQILIDIISDPMRGFELDQLSLTCEDLNRVKSGHIALRLETTTRFYQRSLLDGGFLDMSKDNENYNRIHEEHLKTYPYMLFDSDLMARKSLVDKYDMTRMHGTFVYTYNGVPEVGYSFVVNNGQICLSPDMKDDCHVDDASPMKLEKCEAGTQTDDDLIKVEKSDAMLQTDANIGDGSITQPSNNSTNPGLLELKEEIDLKNAKRVKVNTDYINLTQDVMTLVFYLCMCGKDMLTLRSFIELAYEFENVCRYFVSINRWVYNPAQLMDFEKKNKIQIEAFLKAGRHTISGLCLRFQEDVKKRDEYKGLIKVWELLDKDKDELVQYLDGQQTWEDSEPFLPDID